MTKKFALADGVPRKEGLQLGTSIRGMCSKKLADGVPRKEGLQLVFHLHVCI